jgi:cation diffusion facilitator family transporter
MATGAFIGALKVFVGMWANSQALIADGFQSFAGVVTGFITLISLRVSRWPRDEKHPYGHGKIEFLMSGFFGLLLVFAALLMAVRAISAIISGNLTPPLLAAIGPALISIVCNVSISRFGMCVSRQLNSPVIAANAENTADALSSVATILGIVGARFGYPVLDPIAAIIVAFLIARIGVHIVRSSTGGLMDKSAPESDRVRMVRCVAAVPGVRRVAYLRTRQMGQEMWVDVGIAVPGAISLQKADGIARDARNALMREFDRLQDAVVYLEDEPFLDPVPERSVWRKILSRFTTRRLASGSKSSPAERGKGR